MKDGVYERFMRHSATLVPIGLSGAGLISLITYRLIYPISDDLKWKLYYVELILSVGASFMVLGYMSGLFITVLTHMIRDGVVNGMDVSFIIYALLGLLLNPYVLTVLREIYKDSGVGVDDTMMSLAVIVTTGVSLLFTWALFVGTRGRG